MYSLPDGWVVKTLGEVCDFKRGLTYKKGDEVSFSNNAVLRANNVTLETGTLNFDEIKYINESIKIPKEKILTKGNLLICTASGSKKHLGKVALINQDYNYAFGGFMGVLISNEEIDSKFLYWQTRSKKYFDFILSLADGTNINNLRFNQLSEFKIPIPPLAEQQVIVTKLDTCFTQINQAKTNLEQNLQNTKDLFQSTLTQVFTEQGDDWMVKTLGEVCQVNPLKSEINIRKNMLVSFLPMKDLTVGKKIVTPNQEKEFEKVSTSYTYFAENDVILAKVTPCFENGKSGVVKNLTNGIGFGSSEYFVYRADLSAVIPEWIYYCISDQKFIGIGKLNMGGASGLQRLTKNFVTNYKIPIPPLAEQKQITKKLDKLSQHTKMLEENHQNQLKSLETLKQSLLEKVFRGG